MKPAISLNLLFCLVAAVANAPAHAKGCGQTLFGSVTLTADLVCPAGVDGLIIGADGVRIELNGFSIVGPYTFAAPSAPATGVISSRFAGVEIVGPGTITGFERPVDIDGGKYHRISGVTIVAESGFPVSVRNATRFVIELSRVTAVEIASDPGFEARQNKIVDNDIGGGPGLPAGGIFLRGCGTADNVVSYNRVDPGLPIAPVYGGRQAMVLSDGAHSNQILRNQIVKGEVQLVGSSKNLVVGNDMQNDGSVGSGVSMFSSYAPVACAGGIVLPVRDNVVRGNRVSGSAFGIYIDSPPQTGLATKNLVTGNNLNDHPFAGMFFGAGSVANDARGNTFTNVPTIALDFGSGNLWP